jgi:hypothetical protein
MVNAWPRSANSVSSVVASECRYCLYVDLPVGSLFGHSFGGLLAEKLLGGGHAIAGPGIAAAPIKGVLACSHRP